MRTNTRSMAASKQSGDLCEKDYRDLFEKRVAGEFGWCPKCGSALDSENDAGDVFCNHCSAETRRLSRRIHASEMNPLRLALFSCPRPSVNVLRSLAATLSAPIANFFLEVVCLIVQEPYVS